MEISSDEYISEQDWRLRKASVVMYRIHHKTKDLHSAVDKAKQIFDGVSEDVYAALWYANNIEFYDVEKTLRILVAGGRDFDDYPRMKRILDHYISGAKLKGIDEVVIIQGEAKGADSLAGKYADEMGHTQEKYPANWDKYGKSAGYKRNVEMARRLPDVCFCFWDGLSVGTEHMINIAKEHKIPVKIKHY